MYLSAYLLSELAKEKISLVVSDDKHNPIGQYLPLYGAHNVGKCASEQLEWSLPSKKRVWQMIVKEKIRQQARFLEDEELFDAAKILYASIDEVRSGDTTNREAYAARVYFSALFGKDFSRNDDTPLNASLNYGYTILLSLVNREVVARGLLTQCGICHRNEYNQFNLSCDFMEPFRPAIDRAVVSRFEGSFDSAMRRSLAGLAQWRVSYREGSYRLGSVVSLFVQDCVSALQKRIPASAIAGFECLP